MENFGTEPADRDEARVRMTPTADEQLIEQPWTTGLRGDLRGFAWSPESQPATGCVVMVHGLGEHVGRYRGLAADLAAAGWASVAADLPGHGNSPGRRGHIESYRRTLMEIGEMLGAAAKRFPDLPLVLLGHSMGGNLAANYVLRRDEIAPRTPDPVGLVLSGPMFLPTNPPPRPHIFAAWLTGQLLPWLTIRAPVDAERLTRNSDVVEQLRDDPLVHNRLSLYLGTQLLAQGRHALDHASEIDVPTLLLHGQDDPITSHLASESFATRVGPLATFVPLAGMLHEIFHEPDRDRVIAILAEWLQGLKQPESDE